MQNTIEVKKIFFDMDGVLADFDRGVRELCGMEPVGQDDRTPEKDAAQWARVREVDNFYDRLELMPGARWELPYDGGSKMLLVEDVDDREFLCRLLSAMYDELPRPKKKK